MSFKDITIKTEYRSGQSDVIRDFYIPILSQAVLYKRAVGFFSSTALIQISKGLVDGLIKPQKDPNPRRNEIIGDTFIKPKTTHTYEYVGDKIATWTYDKKLPLKIAIDGNKITIRWTSSYSGQFDLSCGSVKKTIVVESLF